MDYILLISVLFISIIGFIQCFEKEITVNVRAGAEDCFYQHVKAGQVIDLEYQVIDGSQFGDLDISFQMTEPNGRIIFADFKKSDNVLRHEAHVEGDYKFCFDNTFSTFSPKVVFFELILENDDEENNWGNKDFDLEGLTPEEFYDMKIQDIQDAIGRVRVNVNQISHLQDLLRTYEARDRNIAEENNYLVNMWSVVQILAMLLVGVTTVVLVKSLFDEQSKVNKIWNKIDHTLTR